MLMYILFLVTFTVVTILDFLISVVIYRFVIYSKAFSSLNQLIQLETTKDSMCDIHLQLKDQNGNSQLVVMFNFTPRTSMYAPIQLSITTAFQILSLSYCRFGFHYILFSQIISFESMDS